MWLVLFPYVPGFAVHTAVAFNTAAMGVLVMAFAVWAMFSDKEFCQRWYDGHSF